VREGRFRSDLFHRLSVFRLDLPPLRERIDDLSQLVPALIDEYNARSGRHVRVVPPMTVYRAACVQLCTGPDNVRELRNVIERAVLLAQRRASSRSNGCSWGEGVAIPEDAQPGNGRVRRWQPASCIPLDGSMALDEMDRYIIRRRRSSAPTTTSPPRRARSAPPARRCATASRSMGCRARRHSRRPLPRARRQMAEAAQRRVAYSSAFSAGFDSVDQSLYRRRSCEL
jgi:transcriptional regulator with GAF, ATPase, and Fis domain